MKLANMIATHQMAKSSTLNIRSTGYRTKHQKPFIIHKMLALKKIVRHGANYVNTRILELSHQQNHSAFHHDTNVSIIKSCRKYRILERFFFLPKLVNYNNS